jgi:hypothetical protein
MYHYMEFAPCLIGERNHQIFREAQALRREKRLRESHKVGGARLDDFALRLKSTLHLLRRVGLVGR